MSVHARLADALVGLLIRDGWTSYRHSPAAARSVVLGEWMPKLKPLLDQGDENDGLRQRLGAVADQLDGWVAARGRLAGGSHDDGVNKAQANAAQLIRRAIDDPAPTSDALSITCPVCGRTSWHPDDVANGYCGACHATTNGRVTRPCIRCEGCGLVADSEDQEPWTAWTSLPPASGLAVRLGLAHPILCPSCHGAKRVSA